VTLRAYQPMLPASAAGATAGAAGRFTLCISGRRPLSFMGRRLAHHAGHAGSALRHELELYRADDGRYVGGIRVHLSGAADRCYLRVADGLDEVLGFFESFDARADVPAGFEADDPALAPADVLLRAAALACRLADAQTQYDAALGSFLRGLDA
jgi:hypothetical protein